jgi:threonine synthase
MDEEFNRKQAGQEVFAWYKSLKNTGGFGPVHDEILEKGRQTFESERVSDAETVETIKSSYKKTNYVLDPHSAVGVTASERSIAGADSQKYHISLSTAHPAKFSGVVTAALADEPNFNFEEQVLPDEFKALSTKEKRVTLVENSWEKVREIVKSQAEKDIKAESS